ncbi:hypothetical protein BDW22DRAFT_1339276 [Trametopsis cervina]|nr:hypothetical protein BDW22DRAFT_1339276 [Trametopsis cervina]
MPSTSIYFVNGLKIPLILTGAALAHVSYTSPNPQPPATEAKRFSKGDTYMAMAGPAVLVITKFCHWAYACCESAVIIANVFPSATSSTVLRWLVRQGFSAAAVRPTTTTVTGWAVLCVAGLLRIACYRELGRFFTFHLSIKDNHHLVTTGPYGIVRHPGYTALIFTTVGTVLSHVGKGSWYREAGWLSTTSGKALAFLWLANVTWTIAILVGIRVGQEDEALRSQFPSEWERYAQKTPYKLIPYIY